MGKPFQPIKSIETPQFKLFHGIYFKKKNCKRSNKKKGVKNSERSEEPYNDITPAISITKTQSKKNPEATGTP